MLKTLIFSNSSNQVFKSAQFQFKSTTECPMAESQIADKKVLQMMGDLTKPEVLMVALKQLTNAGNANNDQALLALGDAQKQNLQKVRHMRQC